MAKIIEAFEAGTGIYSIAETALLTFEGAPLLSFTDFVEALYVSELRSPPFSISLHRIRKAIDAARELKGVEHPFAHPDFRTVIIGKSIHIQERDSPEVLTSLAPDSGQTSDKVILESFINSLEFDDRDVAKLYVAYIAEGEVYKLFRAQFHTEDRQQSIEAAAVQAKSPDSRRGRS
jgi:hypothetical protein